jgi:hypothetical protein
VDSWADKARRLSDLTDVYDEAYWASLAKTLADTDARAQGQAHLAGRHALADDWDEFLQLRRDRRVHEAELAQAVLVAYTARPWLMLPTDEEA